MLRIGITGGIGSGKTTFCKVWEELGAFVLYADDFAKELMITDKKLINSIKKTFGEKAYFEDGSLNREFLSEEAFSKNRVQELNDLVHPAIWERADELAEEKQQEGVKIFAKEAAILLNNGRPKDLDYVVLLLADDQERISRVKKRDSATEEQVSDRINNQPQFEDLASMCDFIVMNDGSLEELRNKAREIYKFLNQIA